MKFLFSLQSRKYQLVMVLMLMLGIFSASLLAGPSSIDQAKKAKIDTTIRIVEEQIKRGLYPLAQRQLDNLKASEEFSAYISQRQNQTITQLQTKIDRALEERAKITRSLQQSDVLVQQGDYQGSLKLLQEIKDSPFANEQERQMIRDSYQEVVGKVTEQQQKWQALYNSSVSAYNSAQLDVARQGFMQIVESGYAVQGSKTPEQYISLIDAAVTGQSMVSATEEPMPLEDLITEQTEQPKQGMRVTSEPSATDMAIEPIDLLEMEVDKQVADRASVQSQLQELSYLEVIKLKRSRQVSYTKAIVADAIDKAQQSLDNQQFDQARQALRRAFSTIEKNKMLLGDTVYSDYKAELTNLEQKVNEANLAADQKAEEDRRIEADKLTVEIRENMETQRARAVEDYMVRAYAFQKEQRYEEALGQLEQLLAIDRLNQSALIQKQTLEYLVNYRKQRQVQDEMDQEEIELMLDIQRRSIPHADEFNYPHNWKEIAERRDALVEKIESPADKAIHELLDQMVDLSMLTENTTLEEAIGILANSVSPALPVFVYWKDLSENGFIEKETIINISGQSLKSVVLRTALNRILEAVSAGGFAELSYVVQQGTVTIATRESLPANFITKQHDVTDLLNPPSTGFGQMGGGGMGGGGMGGGGMGGGGMGGMGGGGMGGNFQQMYRA